MTPKESDALLYNLLRQHPDFDDLKETDGLLIGVSVAYGNSYNTRHKCRNFKTAYLLEVIRGLFIVRRETCAAVADVIVRAIDKVLVRPTHSHGVLSMPVSVANRLRGRE